MQPHTDLPRASHVPVIPERMTSLDLMCCRQVTELPAGPDWIYEMKLRGFRVTALKSAEEAWLVSRNHLSLGEQFPEIIKALQALPCDQALVDGQLVALDESGCVCGCPVEMSGRGQRPAAVGLVVFDLLELDGRYMQGLPLGVRKQRMSALLAGAPQGVVAAVDLAGTPQDLLEQARMAGQPGIVAKRRDSTYEEGRRTMEWLKCLVPAEAGQARSGFITHFCVGQVKDVMPLKDESVRRAA
ncbi:hypothetical protein [Verrucomicrobium spinosum]|uniref:ATP-dependent DNA ligase n=1 Tax=Verrucomicrobium spinosum TaxID=2736 RepID=UPI0009D79866|nr:hypothetical protein [Verrucomicrobium spinosum]